jgi:hypothetical protein
LCPCGDNENHHDWNPDFSDGLIGEALSYFCPKQYDFSRFHRALIADRDWAACRDFCHAARQGNSARLFGVTPIA